MRSWLRYEKLSKEELAGASSVGLVGSHLRGDRFYGEVVSSVHLMLTVRLEIGPRQSCNRTNILCAFKRRRVRTIQLTHTTLELIDGFVLMRLHPHGELLFQCGEMSDPVTQQGGTDHGDVRAGHQ